MSAAEPSRRTLVKGAAWSVPLIAATAPAAHATASRCRLTITAQCDAAGRLVFRYSITGPRPANFQFTLTQGGTGGGEPTIAAAAGIQRTGNVFTVPATAPLSGDLLYVTRTSNSGTRTFSVAYTGSATTCIVTSPATGRFVGSVCGTP